MATHLLKPGPISTLSTRCGISLIGNTERGAGQFLGTDFGLPHIDCVDCLRELVASERIQRYSLPDTAETRWICGGDTGTSSATIWSVMTNISLHGVNRDSGVPHDPADFGRCHRLLEKFPEWRARMPEVAVKFPAWQPFVGAWETMTALYLEEIPTGTCPKLYAEMLKIHGNQ